MTLVPNFITNSDAIVKRVADLHQAKFVARINDAKHGSFLPFFSRFSTLHVDRIGDRALLDLIFDSNNQFDPDLKDLHQFIQIQRYVVGDYIIPHQDVYSVTKLHLITLTSSDVDGLVVQDGETLIRVLDTAGQKLDFTYNSWHWVDPVINIRYSLVIGE